LEKSPSVKTEAFLVETIRNRCC